MKKRIFLMLVVMGMMLLSACGASEESKTMYELYVQASEKLSKADSLEMNMTVDMSMDYDGETINIGMTGLVKEVIRSETDIDMQMEMETTFLGISMGMTTYYKDGVYYTNAMGDKAKEAMPFDEVMQLVSVQPFAFPVEAIKNEAINEVNEAKEMTFTLDSAALNNELIEQMGSLSDTLGDTADLGFGDVALKIVLDKSNNFQSFTMAFPMEIAAEDERITYEVALSMEIVQIGGVTIEFPDDLDTY